MRRILQLHLCCTNDFWAHQWLDADVRLNLSIKADHSDCQGFQVFGNIVQNGPVQ